MKNWEHKDIDHPVYKKMDGILSYLHNSVDTINTNSPNDLSKLYYILSKTREALYSIDPFFYPKRELDAIDNIISNEEFLELIHESIKFHGNFNYEAAFPYTEELANSAYRLSGASSKDDDIKLLKDMENNFTKRHNKTEKEIIDLKLTLEYELKEAREKINEIHALEVALNERINQTKETIKNNEKMMLIEKNKRMEDFSTEQKARQQSFKNESEKAINSIINDAKSAYNSQEEIINKKTASLLQKIDDSNVDITKKHNSIKDIYELVAEDGIAGGYKKNADDEKSAANLWRGITMGCYALIILWVLFKNTLGFETFINNQVQWPVLIITISITAIAFIAAQFSSKQSRIHLINEQKMRWFALEVKAIDPFISSLPESEKNDLKRQLSEKLFCQHRTEDFSNESESHSKSLDALSSVVNNLSDTIKTITKK
ncbi:hypothetical protein [Vreelandella titanicae]|nr:hypothetical protein [Halomonas titanicae]